MCQCVFLALNPHIYACIYCKYGSISFHKLLFIWMINQKRLCVEPFSTFPVSSATAWFLKPGFISLTNECESQPPQILRLQLFIFFNTLQWPTWIHKYLCCCCSCSEANRHTILFKTVSHHINTQQHRIQTTSGSDWKMDLSNMESMHP